MKLILFGASATGADMLAVLSRIDGCEICAFTDNDSSKWEDTFCGVPVVSPEEAIKSDCTIIITAGYYPSLHIACQLEIIGRENYAIGINHILNELDEAQRERIRNEIPGANAFNFDISYKLNEELIKPNEESKATFLAVCEFYPSEEKPASGGFIHRRIKSYHENGIGADVFLLTQKELGVYEYDGVTVYTGDRKALELLLRNNKYRKLLIHYLTLRGYISLRLIKNKLPLIVWVHGYETERWDRNTFNITEQQLKNREVLNEADKKKFYMLRKIYTDEAVKKIFVSNWIKDVAEEDSGCKIRNYEIINNVIDDELFNYVEKDTEQRKKILVIRSFSCRKYACDIIVNIILELSKRDVFQSLEFAIYGDGALYDETMAPLIGKEFENVKISRGFMTQEEVSALHKQYGVFLCPTRHDAQGVSMCEAMSSGLVVVTNKVSAIPEFVDEKSGLLCDGENYTQMADAIERLYDNPQLFKEISEGAANRIRRQTSKNIVIPKEIASFS